MPFDVLIVYVVYLLFGVDRACKQVFVVAYTFEANTDFFVLWRWDCGGREGVSGEIVLCGGGIEFCIFWRWDCRRKRRGDGRKEKKNSLNRPEILVR